VTTLPTSAAGSWDKAAGRRWGSGPAPCHHGSDVNGNALILHSPLGFVVAFGAGVVSFLSPCVLPLVPSYLSMMSGVGTADLATSSQADRGRLLRSTLLFVAGFTVVFAAFEATASGVGHTLQDHQQLLNEIAGAAILVMGLVFAGIVRPGWLVRERRVQVRPSRLGPWAAPVMGMAFAFGWTPCIGPALAAVISLASSSHTLGRGECMLVAFSLGLGVPFVALGVAFGRLAGVLGFVRRHVRIINLGSGLVLAALGVLLLTDSVDVVSTFCSHVLDDIGLDRLATV
jgi:cytochrome c-type biogenesis protein